MNGCPSSLARCQCGIEGEHTDHQCECGGSWRDDGTVILYPGGLTEDEALAKATEAGWKP